MKNLHAVTPGIPSEAYQAALFTASNWNHDRFEFTFADKGPHRGRLGYRSRRWGTTEYWYFMGEQETRDRAEALLRSPWMHLARYPNIRDLFRPYKPPPGLSERWQEGWYTIG